MEISLVAASALTGFLVGLTGVGAGALGAVFLALLYPLRLTPPRLIATDIVHAMPLAMFASFGHFLIGNVDPRLVGTLLPGSVPAVVVRAALSAKLPHGLLRLVRAAVLSVTGIKLWWSAA